MKKLFLAISLAACASTMAFAQDQAPQGAQGAQGGGGMRSQFMDACGADMQKLCSAAQSRDDRRTCMTANKDKFSDSCKAFMANHPMHMHPQAPQGGQQ